MGKKIPIKIPPWLDRIFMVLSATLGIVLPIAGIFGTDKIRIIAIVLIAIILVAGLIAERIFEER